jgi:hypothetical protein
MAFSRLSYDNCSYKSEILQSVGTLSYVLSPEKFVNPNPTRIAFGILGGNDTSIVAGNMVDVESDLYGITRQQSKCPSLKFLNECSGKDFGSCQPKQIVIRGNPSNQGRIVDTTPLHLRESQMFRYTPVFLPKPYQQPRC